jgi:hypothetical protein
MLTRLGLAAILALALGGCAEAPWCLVWLAGPDGALVSGPAIAPYCSRSTPGYGYTPMCQQAERRPGNVFEPIEDLRPCAQQ